MNLSFYFRSLTKTLFKFTCFVMFSTSLVYAQSPVPDDAELKQLANGFSLSEGPYWHPDGYLLFSDVSESIIYKWSEEGGVETYLSPSGETNGISADRFGNIIVAQHDERQVGRIESDLTITPLATNYQGDALHSPNDLVIKSDGAIFFTDPPWGGNTSEIDFHGVYRISPTSGEVQLLEDELSYPNGIAFSPDESKLYVSESITGDIYVYDVMNDSTLANGSLFVTVNEYGNADQDGSDGIKIDNEGNLWATGSEGVAIFAPDGSLLDIINVPGSTTNLGWGGTDSLTLFITNFNGLYSIKLGPLEKPEAPTNLEASPGGNGITLRWDASAESIKFVSVYKSNGEGDFEKVLVTSNPDSVIDPEYVVPSSVTYKITVTDVMGFESEFSNEVDLIFTGVEDNDQIIETFELQQNYPNPFNPTTNIGYQIPENTHVRLEVFDMKGQKIQTLVNKRQSTGRYTIAFDASNLASGVYIYQLTAGEFSQSKKLFLIK